MARYNAFILCLLLLTGLGYSAAQAAAPGAKNTSTTNELNSAILSESAETGTATDPEQEIQLLQNYFFAAARTGEVTVLTEFLSAGYPVNERNAQSYTALMIAAYAGQADAVDALLKTGADACLRDKRGHTALMGAMIKAEWDIARTLYDIDCDKENTAKATDVVTDKNQMTAAQFAEVFGQSEKFKALGEMTNLQP
jgi:ankyrin repeat protein